MTASKPVPEACIRRADDMSQCGRGIAKTEYSFNDPSHAVTHYADGKTLRACPKCVAMWLAREGVAR